jgi:hypothetical protein
MPGLRVASALDYNTSTSACRSCLFSTSTLHTVDTYRRPARQHWNGVGKMLPSPLPRSNSPTSPHIHTSTLGFDAGWLVRAM